MQGRGSGGGRRALSLRRRRGPRGVQVGSLRRTREPVFVPHPVARTLLPNGHKCRPRRFGPWIGVPLDSGDDGFAQAILRLERGMNQ